MFLHVCVPFLPRSKPFIEPFAMNARALEYLRAIIAFEHGAG
jgi:hypothetical protein